MTTDQAEAVATQVEEATVEDTDTRPTSRRKGADREPRTSSGGRWRFVLLFVSAVVAASGAFAWWQASHDDGIKSAETRDTVLLQARQGITTMNTLDYRTVDEGVKAWSSVTTGTLRDQLAGVSADDRQLLADQEKISTGRVVDAAVVDLDARTATVIAAVEVTVKDDAKPDSEPTVKRNRFTADLVKKDGTWKLESLQQVAVDLS